MRQRDVGAARRAPGETRTSTTAAVAVLVSIAAQVAYALVDGSLRDRLIVVVLAAAAIAMAVDAITHLGPARGVGVIVAVPAVAFTAEVIGTRTGAPFGEYTYATGRIGPEVADVPVLISAAWLVGAWAIWRVAGFVVGPRRLLRVAATVVCLVGWDLYLDPQMVQQGLWQWVATDLGLPGIENVPVTNYLGWAVVGTLVVGILEVARVGTTIDPAPPLVPVTWFVWTWVGSAFAQLFLLADGALRDGVAYGALVMGLLGVPTVLTVAAWLRARPSRTGTMTT